MPWLTSPPSPPAPLLPPPSFVEELNYAKLGWTDAEMGRLALVLPLCSELRILHLTGDGL